MEVMGVMEASMEVVGNSVTFTEASSAEAFYDFHLILLRGSFPEC